MNKSGKSIHDDVNDDDDVNNNDDNDDVHIHASSRFRNPIDFLESSKKFSGLLFGQATVQVF